MTVILLIPNRFKNFFSLEDSLVNLQLNGFKNPTASCICCYTTLWNVNVSKTSHWKNFLNWLRIDRIIVMSLWLRFLAHPVVTD